MLSEFTDHDWQLRGLLKSSQDERTYVFEWLLKTSCSFCASKRLLARSKRFWPNPTQLEIRSTALDLLSKSHTCSKAP